MTINLTIQPDPAVALDLSVDGNDVEVTTREEGEYGVVVRLPLPALRAALDGIETADERAVPFASPDLMDGGVTSAAIEAEADRDFFSGAGSTLMSPANGLRYQREQDEADRRTAEAERQRDEWKRHHDRIHGQCQWAKAEHEVTKLRAEQPRPLTTDDSVPANIAEASEWLIDHANPGDFEDCEACSEVQDRECAVHHGVICAGQHSPPLTPEDITDEMVERYLNHRDPDEVRDWSLAGYREDLVTKARAHLAATLTEPSTRPEWETESAERITGAVWGVELPNEAGETGTFLAARLARHGYKVVPVTGAES